VGEEMWSTSVFFANPGVWRKTRPREDPSGINKGIGSRGSLTTRATRICNARGSAKWETGTCLTG
jgi:hypothetical protein